MSDQGAVSRSLYNLQTRRASAAYSRVHELENGIAEIVRAVIPGVRPWLPKTETEQRVADIVFALGLLPKEGSGE